MFIALLSFDHIDHILTTLWEQRLSHAYALMVATSQALCTTWTIKDCSGLDSHAQRG